MSSFHNTSNWNYEYVVENNVSSNEFSVGHPYIRVNFANNLIFIIKNYGMLMFREKFKICFNY